jgi:hypothetical protein
MVKAAFVLFFVAAILVIFLFTGESGRDAMHYLQEIVFFSGNALFAQDVMN